VTQTYHPNPAQPPAVQVWRLYRVWRADGVLLYIGVTGREPLARLIEHLYEQQWAHEVARWEVDPRPYYSEADVLAAEEAAIRSEKPIRNWIHNDGPHRQWQPKVGSYRHPGRRQTAPRPASTPRLSPRWRRRRNWAIGLTSGWLALTLLLWWVDAAWTAVGVPGRTYPIGGVLLAALVPALRLRRRRDRKAAVAVVTVACAALWLITG
jgi:hypothetical protein